jgi:putative ABC transport system ATP-binding protein
MPTPPLIQLRRLTKSYREGERQRPILKDVDLNIHAGECVVLVGRSGSGKSTLLNLISGIDLPDHGEVLFNGQDITRLAERDRTLFRRRHVGFVFQSYNLVPTLTVQENLLLPLELNGVTGSAAQERCQELLGQLGLADRSGSYPDRLSGGEQQRIAIARALAHDPEVVLADEPTGNLDLDTGREVLNLLDQATRATGKTLVMVTHSREVVGLADRILSLSQGALTEQPP